MYSPGSPFTIPPMVSVFTKGIGWMGEDLYVTAPVSSSFDYSKAVYYPIVLPASCTVRRVWWANGASVDAGYTVEVGIYSDAGQAPGSKIVSGSAAQGSALEVQFVDVTDTVLPAGLYWIAVSPSTNAVYLMLCQPALKTPFRLEQGSAYPLPATATPVASTYGYIYLFGFATTDAP